jgi:hypothetical protein
VFLDSQSAQVQVKKGIKGIAFAFAAAKLNARLAAGNK